MNAAADCHANTTAENIKSIYMLTTCCTDTTILHQHQDDTNANDNARGGDSGGNGELLEEHSAASRMADLKQTLSSSSSSSRGGGGGGFWSRGSTTGATPTKPTMTPTPQTKNTFTKNRSSSSNNNNNNNNNLPYSNSVPTFPKHNNNNNNNKSNNNSLGNTKPFASNPLIYRNDDDDDNDSWWGGQSFFSLLASDTMEMTATNEDSQDGNNAVDVDVAPSYAYFTPQRKQQQQPHQQQQNRSLSHNALSQLKTMPPPTVTTEDDSPMIELSLAKQVANMAQMTNGNLRKTNREMLRNYRTMNHHAMGSSSSNSRTNNNNSSSSSPASPTKRTRENTVESSTGGIIGSGSGGSSVESGLGSSTNVNHHHSKKLASMAVVPDDEGRSGRSSASAMETDEDNTTRPHYMEYMHAPAAPVWSKGNTTTANSTDIDSELVSTYKYPRLCLQDPIHIIEGLIDGRYDNYDQVVRREMWWFHAAHRMETTLRHVQDDHWRGMLSTMMMATTSSTTNSTSSSIAPPAMTNYTSNLTSKMKGSDSTNSFATPTTTDGCVAMEELCLGKQHQQQHHHQQQPFSPSNTPTNVWSEPCASTMNVRGRTYSRDGVKVESGPSLFVMLGVDSFVSGGGEKSAGGGVDSNSTASSSLGTASYLRRWRGVCAEMELHQPPFLLIINFIVPWGNFQAYLVRPDADEGPFSSSKRDHPSEKAWRQFMEGSTEYRNKRFKLIPRIVAGPWVVKKMVGSTPALIGTKLPMSYRGSISDNYLEISLDVTKGPAFGNSVANTVVGKADAVTVDLGFVIEGNEEDGTLPEQVLGLFRLHHLNMKKAPTQHQWNKER